MALSGELEIEIYRCAMQIKIYAKLQKVEWIEELSGVKLDIILCCIPRINWRDFKLYFQNYC